jgi:hypothetical protein
MIGERYRVASISYMLGYHRLCWLENVCRLKLDKLLFALLLADTDSCRQSGRAQNTLERADSGGQ